MSPADREPIDPKEYKKLLPENPGSEEGVTPQVEKLRRDHQLPDAEADFEAMARELAAMDLQYHKFFPTLELADSDPDVETSHQLVEKSFLEHDQKLDRSIRTENITQLSKSLGVLLMTFNNGMNTLMRRYEKSGEPVAQNIRKDLERLQNDADAVTMPLRPAHEQLLSGVLPPRTYYEVVLLARNELRQMTEKLRKIEAQ